MARPSAFRNALQVSGERIRGLSDDDLTSLMRDLLRAEAYRAGANRAEVRINTKGSAADEGADAWTPAPTRASVWLGAGETCWQFKAGTAGQPARLAGEVLKSLPRHALDNGGRFVLVANAAVSGKNGGDERLRALRSEAAAAGVPEAGIEVLTSENLVFWANEHPAVAARWAGR